MGKSSMRDYAQQLAEGGITPLEFMLDVLRDEEKPFEVRFDAAKNAAPYLHPRLAAIQARVVRDDGEGQRVIERVIIDAPPNPRELSDSPRLPAPPRFREV